MKVRTALLSALVLEVATGLFAAQARAVENPEGMQAARESDPCSTFNSRFSDVIVLQGSQLHTHLQVPISRMRLMVLRNEQWEPIPFQVDEKTEDGSFLFTFGEENDQDRMDRKLDPWDEVVFMAGDAGCRRISHAYPLGYVNVEEIGITGPLTGEQGWFYLFSFDQPPPLSDVDLIQYVPAFDRIDSAYYHTGYSRKEWDQKAVMEYFAVPTEVGGEGVNWFDSAKIWTWIKFFFSFFKITIHSDDWTSSVPAYIDGPVRAVVKKRMAIKLGFGLHTPNVDADLIYYPHFFISGIVISIPFDPSILTSSLRISIGTDLNRKAAGMLFWNSENPEPVLVDGRMSPQEKAMDMSPDQWRVVSGAQGKYMGKAVYAGNFKLSNIKLDEGRYIDDYTHVEPPENEPGTFGSYNWTWDITNGKRGKYVVWMEAHYGPRIENEADLAACLNVTDHPLHVRIGSREMLNCLLIPPPGFTRDVLPEMYREPLPAGREEMEEHDQ